MADVLAHPLTAPTQAGPSTHWSKNYRAVFSPMMLLLLVSSFTRQNSERMLTLRLINNNYNYTNASSYVIQFGHSPTREVWTQVEAVDVYHLSGWGFVFPKVNAEFHKIHCLEKSPSSVFIVSVFFWGLLTVAPLAFYFSEVRTKQPTSAASLQNAITIWPSGTKTWLFGPEQWQRARFWRKDFLWLPHDSDGAL